MTPWAFVRAGIGTAGAQGISLLCLPVLTRMYSPADFAPWAIGLAAVMFIGSIATLRYDLAIVVERDHTKGSALFWITLLVSLGFFLCAAAGILLMASRHWLFFEENVPGFEYLIVVWLFFFIINQTFVAWMLRQGAFLSISMSQIGNALATNLMQFSGFLLVSHDGCWLLFGSITGQMISLTIIVWACLKSSSPPASLFTCYGQLREVASAHKRFVIYSFPFSVFNAIRDRAVILLLGSLASPKDLGLYSQAWRLSNVPAGLFGSAIRPVLFYAVAEKGAAEYESHLNRIILLIVLVGTPLLALVIYRPNDVCAFALGNRWREIGPLAAAMAFPAFIFSLSSWMDRLLDSLSRQNINLITEIVSSVTSIGGLLLAMALGASLLVATQVQAALLSVNYIVFIYLAYRYAGYRKLFLLKILVLFLAILATVFGLLHVVWT